MTALQTETYHCFVAEIGSVVALTRAGSKDTLPLLHREKTQVYLIIKIRIGAKYIFPCNAKNNTRTLNFNYSDNKL